jgi:hypothetical protein
LDLESQQIRINVKIGLKRVESPQKTHRLRINFPFRWFRFSLWA